MPLAALTFNPETGLYGFRVWFEGQRPHYEMEVFASRQRAQNWVDPQNEYVWEETPSPDGRVLAVARRFKEGSVSERMLEWPEQREQRTRRRKR
jgi:hypothetical protein